LLSHGVNSNRMETNGSSFVNFLAQKETFRVKFAAEKVQVLTRNA